MEISVVYLHPLSQIVVLCPDVSTQSAIVLDSLLPG